MPDSTHALPSVLMVYPNLGFSGVFVRHVPLSLLYASIELVKHGFKVDIVDTRVFPNAWKSMIKNLINSNTLVVGISVMTGKPIKNAIGISRYVKSLNPAIKVVWGGPHATFFPESILNGEWSCDYVISGYAVKSFFNLVQCLAGNEEPFSVKGVSYRKGNEISIIPHENTSFEFVDFREIPYHLIKDYSVYGQLDHNKRIFSLYSALGCPYKCAFCSAPAEYANVKGKKWIPLDVKEVVNHIEYVVGKYGADYIYFIDNDSFVDLAHVESIIDEINSRSLKVKIGFRGARINEIKKMSGIFIDKLAKAGTDMLHIGAESGSDRILELIDKNCTVRDIIECNIELARHPDITVGYNFIIGIPSETLEEIKQTRDLMLRLISDNPNCIIFQPNRYRPIPGTKLFEIVSKKWGYVPPATLEEWANIEVEGDFTTPWYTKEIKQFCELLLVASYFIDNKIEKVTSGNTLFYKVLRFVNKIYRPIALFRLKHGYHQFLFEYGIYKIITRIISKIKG
ncbi:MAG: B12-binding domain-containing radical SAM protein [Nitrospirae bacterium]|nr:B12-binding domain-containing radical SAM protein [Nitrospirota bacterium]